MVLLDVPCANSTIDGERLNEKVKGMLGLERTALHDEGVEVAGDGDGTPQHKGTFLVNGVSAEVQHAQVGRRRQQTDQRLEPPRFQMVVANVQEADAAPH